MVIHNQSTTAHNRCRRLIEAPTGGLTWLWLGRRQIWRGCSWGNKAISGRLYGGDVTEAAAPATCEGSLSPAGWCFIALLLQWLWSTGKVRGRGGWGLTSSGRVREFTSAKILSARGRTANLFLFSCHRYEIRVLSVLILWHHLLFALVYCSHWLSTWHGEDSVFVLWFNFESTE